MAIQIPNHKSQIPNKSQIPMSKNGYPHQCFLFFALPNPANKQSHLHFSLRQECFVLNLVFKFWNLFGFWDLIFNKYKPEEKQDWKNDRIYCKNYKNLIPKRINLAKRNITVGWIDRLKIIPALNSSENTTFNTFTVQCGRYNRSLFHTSIRTHSDANRKLTF